MTWIPTHNVRLFVSPRYILEARDNLKIDTIQGSFNVKTQPNRVACSLTTAFKRQETEKKLASNRLCKLDVRQSNGAVTFILYCPLTTEIDYPALLTAKTLIASKWFKIARKHALTTSTKNWSTCRLATSESAYGAT
jgi:hypothetical protein